MHNTPSDPRLVVQKQTALALARVSPPPHRYVWYAKLRARDDNRRWLELTCINEPVARMDQKRAAVGWR